MKGRPAEANPDFDRALEIDPSNATPMLGRALAMFTSGQMDRAVVALDQILAKGHQDAFIYVLRGKALLAKDPDKALADFDRALRLKPEFGDAYASRGSVWLKKKDYTRALADLDRAIALEGGKIPTYYARASVYEAQGKMDLATSDLRKAAELQPKNVFDILAQADAKRRLQAIDKGTPCGSAGAESGGAKCL